jgi:hypothetical protein
MVYFVKTTDNGIIVAEKAIGTKTVTIAGVTREVNTQGGKLGFVAWKSAKAELEVVAGEKLPFSITDKVVKRKDGTVMDNLYWCNPD